MTYSNDWLEEMEKERAEARAQRKQQEPIELNDFQMNILQSAANGLGRVLVVLLPNAADSPEDREKLNQMIKDTEYLVEHGFMENITDEFQESVKMARKSYGRETMVLTTTDMSQQMFKISPGSELVN